MPDRLEKRCQRCARPFSDRKKYRDFDAVRYCGERCRRNRFTGEKRDVAVVLLEMLVARGTAKTLCPSEVARRVRPDDWRPLMPVVRAAAWDFVAHGSVRVTQRGHPVEPDQPGPIRIGLVPVESR